MKIKAEKKQFGSLSGLYIPGEDTETCVVLLHGYGADASDLASLSQFMGFGDQLSWFFPDAPLRIPIGPGMTGRAWFPIEARELEMQDSRGPYIKSRPAGISKARDFVLKMFESIQAEFSQVILGGFSQGAMLALETSFVARVKPQGLVVLSGTIVDEEQWKKRAPSCEGIPFVLTHGKLDPLLSCQGAEALYDLLVSAGLKGEKHLFSGGHEIPSEVVLEVKAFLKNFLST